MSHSTTGFNFTDADINLAGTVALASTIPGTCISFLALLSYAITAMPKCSREKLDRVSFRLMVYTLVFNLLFGIAYAVTPNAPGPLCDFGAFAVNFTLSFSTFFTTCIAVNLQLVVVHHVNGKQMEKYYLIVTALLSIALNVPTYGLHQYGWNEDTGSCWYSNADPKVRLKWIIGTQSFWVTLASTTELICSCVTLAWMYQFQAVTLSIMSAFRGKHDAEENTKVGVSGADLKSALIIMRDKRYRRVILRIAMYPIVSLIVNYTTVILDLNTTVHGLNTQRDFNLVVVDQIFYGIRPLTYGLIAFTDPSFINAIRELRKKGRSRSGSKITQPLAFAQGVRSPAITTEGEMSFLGNDNTKATVELGLSVEQGSVSNVVTTRIEGVESGSPRSVMDTEMRQLERQL